MVTSHAATTFGCSFMSSDIVEVTAIGPDVSGFEGDGGHEAQGAVCGRVSPNTQTRPVRNT